MFKILTALAAVVSLSLAAFALSPVANTDEDVLRFEARLTGGMATGAAFYEESLSAKVTQVLTIRFRAEPWMQYQVAVQGRPLGILRTDEDGNGYARYTNPPASLPRVRAGTAITVGRSMGRFAAAK